MTNTRSMFRIRILAALSAIVMLVVALFGFGFAKAESAGDGESEPADPGIKRELYYFSDYENCQGFAAGLEADGNLDNVEWYYCAQGREYIDFIRGYLFDGTFNNISNSYVIVEMRQGFQSQIDNGNNGDDLLPNIFKIIFAELKYNGCKIMFVCGTDESRFVNYSEFLDYVDFHVNTDILDTFIQNVFDRALYDSGSSQSESKLSNCTFIFDDSLVYGVDSHEMVRSWFLRTYFITLIRSGYYTYLYGTDVTVAQVVRDNGISVLCNLSGSSCYDVFAQVYVDLNIDGYAYFYDRNVYAVGTSWQGYAYASAWIQDVLNVRSSYDGIYNKFSVYVYDSDGFDLGEYYEPEVYTTTGPSNALIYNAMVAFINDDDLEAYNNYYGRCVVSYKPIPTGPNGWMILFGLGEGLPLPGWQVIMNEDDAAYYLSGEGIL